MSPDLGIEPGAHWWEASAFSTVSSLRKKATKEGRARNSIWKRPNGPVRRQDFQVDTPN